MSTSENIGRPELLQIKTDLGVISDWITSKRGSIHTKRAFSFEARRWLVWLLMTKSNEDFPTWLNKATRSDAAAYVKFLSTPNRKPFPASILMAAELRDQPIAGAELSIASIERAISALRSMYNDLVEMSPVQGVRFENSPFKRIRTFAPKVRGDTRKNVLTRRELAYVDEALQDLQNSHNLAQYQQQKWIWTALRWAALRRHELAAAVVGDIHYSSDEAGKPIWTLEINAKEKHYVPLSPEFIAGFRQYRAFHGLSELPRFDLEKKDTTPLVLPLRGKTRHLDCVAINRSIKKLLAHAATVARKYSDHESAAQLGRYSSQCARQTQIVLVIDITGDIRLGQEMARHVSITTTRRYASYSCLSLTEALEAVGKLVESKK